MAWYVGLGENFSWNLFIFGPKYLAARRNHVVLLHVLFAQAKMAVWLSQRNITEGSGITEPVSL